MVSGFTPNSKSFKFTKSKFLIILVDSDLKSCCLWAKISKHFYFSENLVLGIRLYLFVSCHIETVVSVLYFILKHKIII